MEQQPLWPHRVMVPTVLLVCRYRQRPTSAPEDAPIVHQSWKQSLMCPAYAGLSHSRIPALYMTKRCARLSEAGRAGSF